MIFLYDFIDQYWILKTAELNYVYNSICIYLITYMGYFFKGKKSSSFMIEKRWDWCKANTTSITSCYTMEAVYSWFIKCICIALWPWNLMANNHTSLCICVYIPYILIFMIIGSEYPRIDRSCQNTRNISNPFLFVSLLLVMHALTFSLTRVFVRKDCHKWWIKIE